MVLVGRNPYRSAYFFGRLLAYSLAGLIAAEMGLFMFQALEKVHFAALLSLLFGMVLAGIALLTLLRLPLPRGLGVMRWASQSLGPLISKPGPYPIFLFGMGTVLLPCGQTLVVFSACALEARPLVGLVNGCALALLTSPSLIAAMALSRGFVRLKTHYHLWMGGATLLIACLALLRGSADMGWISHFSLGRHLVLF